VNATTENRVVSPDEVAGEVHQVFGQQGSITTISPEERKAHYARILASHEEDRRQTAKRETNRWRREAVMAGTVVILAGAIAMMMPLKRILPVFVNHNSDGTFTTTAALSDIPQGQRWAATKATMWLYTVSRERFATATHFNTDQQIVFILSDKATADTYQEEVDPRNKRSPWARYGTRTTVRLERTSEVLSCATQECDSREPDAYQVRYTRVEKAEGQPERRRNWTSTVRFRTVPQIPAWQQVTYNPLNLQVVEYVAQEEGAAQ
jgi:type IV secretion system protein VirB8